MTNSQNLIDASDIPFEKDVQSDPYNLRFWLQYIEHKRTKENNQALILIFERAVQALPGSFKLWKKHLEFRENCLQETKYSENEREYEIVNFSYERSILYLHKMPRIWINYLSFLMKQPRITQTRRTFDRALRALAITQHNKIWKLFKEFAQNVGGITEEKIMKRYVMIYPEKIEDLIEMYKKHKQYKKAAELMIKCLNNPDFNQIVNLSEYEFWVGLADLITDYPGDMVEINADIVLREGINRYTDISGRLWTSLATFYIANERFEKARDVYEEAMEKVMTVRDFTVVFEAYTSFEENMLTGIMEDEATNSKGKENLGVIDLRMERFEDLMNRRPFLVSNVVLRQNPNLIDEWIKRIELYKGTGNEDDIVNCYEEAISTVNYKKAVGELSQIWIHYSEYYETLNRLDKARKVFERAVEKPFKTVAELAKIWCSFAEMEIRHEEFDNAEAILSRAVTPPKNVVLSQINYKDEHVSPQKRIFKSLMVWQMYVDLEESSDNVEKTKAAYDQIIHLRIATPQIIVNYAQFLRDKEYFEDAYKGKKIERTRDIFEQALTSCPSNLSQPLFIMYGKFEEEFGQSRNALEIYKRACKAVDSKFEMYKFYIAKTCELLGENSARNIYESAIETIPDEQQILLLCLDYAKMEIKLGEIDRTRALYGYASQFADPRVNHDFWSTWHTFEVNYGNEDTFKEMLRVKRTVQTKFNTDINYITAQLASQKVGKSTLDIKNFEKGTELNPLEKVVENPDEISGLDFDD
ncbi:hypothetical protein BB558_000990 [Smittium angustum]|uniref:Pre-mRNA-splicing factor SYF1 n=1 Tax=Smittium angustum TaxID=133377 RepID=A0A2U1JCN2_SMIAN|nr:hypothetical protein BB558_000990 [Smittium angustum]